MNWIEGVLNDEHVFPSTTASCYPKDFEKTCKGIFKRMFRVFAILYTHFYHTIENRGVSFREVLVVLHFCFSDALFIYLQIYILKSYEQAGIPWPNVWYVSPGILRCNETINYYERGTEHETFLFPIYKCCACVHWQAIAHLNTTFKHYLFFCFEFDLLPACELEAIDTLVQRLKEEYIVQGKKP